LKKNGYEKVSALLGGLSGYETAGGEIEEKK
jgi:3-mercaptopyruvate sulfurtransferase SseA